MTSENGNGYELPPPTLYSRSVKLESTAKGIRLHINVYGNTNEEVREAALKLYCDMEQDCKEHKIPLAKIEVAS
jgi:hypothetical protein